MTLQLESVAQGTPPSLVDNCVASDWPDTEADPSWYLEVVGEAGRSSRALQNVVEQARLARLHGRRAALVAVHNQARDLAAIVNQALGRLATGEP